MERAHRKEAGARGPKIKVCKPNALASTGDTKITGAANLGKRGREETAKPLITVVTPCLNAIGTINANMASVLAAQRSLKESGWELEHLIVEGGSKDGTAEFVEEQVSRHSYCRSLSGISGGAYAAMNTGVQHARGEYIHIINADDLILDPESYAKVLMDGYQQASVVLISSIAYFCRPEKHIKSIWIAAPVAPDRQTWRRRLLRGLHYPHPGFVAKSEIYKHVSFDQGYSLSADYKLMQTILLNLNSADHVFICRQPLIAMAEGGATGSWKARLEGWKQLRAINKELGIRSSSLKRYCSKWWQRMRPLQQQFLVDRVINHMP